MANILNTISFPSQRVLSLLGYLATEVPEEKIASALVALSTPHFYFNESSSLHEQIQAMAPSNPVDQQLQTIWKRFEQSTSQPENGSRFSYLALEAKKSILEACFLKHIYFENCPPSVQAHFIKDLQRILSCPTGRLLVEEILNLKNPEYKICIKAGDIGYASNEEVACIWYSEKPSEVILELPDGLTHAHTPSFTILAHELIHLLHDLQGTGEEDAKQPALHELDGDKEEHRTIYGDLKTRICDNAIRRELNLPVRKYHSVFTPEIDFRLSKAIYYNFRGDLKKLTPSFSTADLRSNFDTGSESDPPIFYALDLEKGLEALSSVIQRREQFISALQQNNAEEIAKLLEECDIPELNRILIEYPNDAPREGMLTLQRLITQKEASSKRPKV